MSYTIKEAAGKTGLTEHTLRYYDKQGLFPFLTRSEGGIRCFEDRDLEWLSMITCLKATGMPIKRIKEYTELCMRGEDTLQQRLDIFLKQRENMLNQIEELNRHLDKVNNKIRKYTEECAAYHQKKNQTI